jgi:hypothetical protein
MYYIYENQDGTKTVVLTFLRAELLNDLDGYGYVEGDVQKASGGQKELEHLDHGKHQTQDITQDGNIDLVTRHLDLALAWCREALYPYTKVETEDGTVMDDVLNETETYIIRMRVPADYSQTSVAYLEQLIHNLLVYYTLWHWLGITKPEGTDKWLAKAEALKDEIKGLLARRCGRLRRPLRPFS